MKNFYLSAFVSLCFVGLAWGEEAGFSGLENAMDAETYEKAGLSKLSSAERAVLDRFIKDYVAGKQQAAATVAAAEAVNRAVKEKRVRPPEVVESKLVGTFKGYGPKTIFKLETGELWKPTNDETETRPPVENPRVIIYRDSFGYKMFIEGAETVRVKRVQ